MARTPRKPATLAPEMPLNADALKAQQNDASERNTLILQQFGDGLPFDPIRYEDKVRMHLSRSAEEMLAAGRALVVAKEHLPHGEWQSFLGRVGIDTTLAKRMCQAAVKFSNGALTHHLIEAAGNKTKLFELLVLDDEDIQELNDGGTVAGLELDDIAGMPASELRKALRDAREEQKAAEQLLSDKNTRLDKLQADLTATRRRIKAQKPDEELAQLRSEFAAESMAVEQAIRTTLRDGVAQLRDAGMTAGETDLAHDTFLAGQLRLIEQALIDLRAEFALEDVDSDGAPSWAQ